MTDFHRSPIRIALLGLGRSMFSEHYPLLKEHPSLFKIVAACDLVKERRDLIAADFPDCRMYRQYQDMLDEPDIELVLVSTCTVDHVAHAMKCLERGFWTLVEPPLALNVEDMNFLRGASAKAKNRLLPLQRSILAPDFLLAKEAIADARLGELYEVRVRKEDFIRRDDWQSVKRLGGGAAYYALTDMMIQVLKLLPGPPIQMWSELKRIASLGDAEDYVHICLKTRTQVSADVEFNGGAIASNCQPSFVIRGVRGQFSVMPGESKGELSIIDPGMVFPRRRSSVRTPPLEDMHEKIPVTRIALSLPAGTPTGFSAFWRCVYDTVRTAKPFPVTVEEAMEALKFSHLAKKTSPFGK